MPIRRADVLTLYLVPYRAMPSNKSFRTKVILAKASKQNRPIPQWFRLKVRSDAPKRLEALADAFCCTLRVLHYIITLERIQNSVQ